MKKLTTRWYYSLKDICEQYADQASAPWPLDLAPTSGLADTLCFITDTEGYLSEDSWWGNVDTQESQTMFQHYLWPEYQDATLVYVDKEVDPWELADETAPDHEEVWDEFKEKVPRIIRWLVDSTERYTVLIDAYKSIEDKLLSRVATVTESSGINSEISEGENKTNGSSIANSSATNRKSNSQTSGQNELTLRNDTPQTGGDFTTDPFVSEASKKNISSTNEQLDVESSSNSNSSSDSSLNSNSNSSRATSSLESTVATDLNTPIERLNEVRQKLRNLYADWASEFSQFVIYAD